MRTEGALQEGATQSDYRVPEGDVGGLTRDVISTVDLDVDQHVVLGGDCPEERALPLAPAVRPGA
jgi:hypothetical protein